LEIPYSNDTELLIDILKYGPDMEVLLAPKQLRIKVLAQLRQAASLYEK
jgi:predicted DNA-binding transcriptional regulator YafY